MPRHLLESALTRPALAKAYELFQATGMAMHEFGMKMGYQRRSTLDPGGHRPGAERPRP
jgi:hypothetical protein